MQRTQTAERPWEVAFVRLAPRERDRRAPLRIVRAAKAPPRCEDRRQVVRVVIVTRAGALRADDRVREPFLAREVLERRGSYLFRRAMPEGPQHMPEQDVAREVEGLTQRVIGRRLGRRNQTER